MDLIFFSKFLKDKDVSGLIRSAWELGIDGYDLVVRDGYVVNPENAGQMLGKVVKELQREKLSVPMVTGPTDLVSPEHPATQPLMAAMSDAGIKLLKLGYVLCDPKKGESYWAKVHQLRKDLAGWETLGRKYGVKVCYHTHSHLYLGLNCASLMHLLQGFDPKIIGAYIDPGHMTVDGEPYELGIDMVREYLAIVGLKDVLFFPERKGDEGCHARRWVPAGQGAVAWSEVFSELVRVGFDGPLSVHAEFKCDNPDEFWPLVKSEIAYFKKKRDAAGVSPGMVKE